jgi:hypothetical protein
MGAALNKDILFFAGLKSAFLTLLALLVAVSSTAHAQEAAPQGLFDTKATAASASTLIAGDREIHLWGVEAAQAMPAVFQLRIRTALDNAIGGQNVQCEAKAGKNGYFYAQCVNSSDVDLGLYMIRQGYVSVNRAQVYGTVFEEPYIQAEMAAQDRSLGIWADEATASAGSSGGDGSWLLGFAFVLFLCIVAAFTVVSVVIMRGFRNVVDAQNYNVEMISKERKLREKERGVVAVMLDAEIKANKSKIEAFIVVYDEMLSALQDLARTPKYKKSGDIVQKQPALDRVVFDRNADKLDMLGDRLSSELIHFYARIKSKPEYENLEPNMEVSEALALLENVLKNARRLDTLAESLIEAFSKKGSMMDAPKED